MDDLKIRPARTGEAKVLTALCRRSKAHWGYDADFIRQCEDALTVTPASISAGCVLAAQHANGEILGVASIAAMQAPGDHDLVHLFVEPRCTGTGLGRALFVAAAELARGKSAKRLLILSDPNAAAFYRRMGARDLGDAPSDSIPGRRLPLLEFTL